MKLLVSLMVLLFAPFTGAGTVYVDRPFPLPLQANSPCFIKLWDQMYINASWVRAITVAENKIPREEPWLAKKKTWTIKFQFIYGSQEVTTDLPDLYVKKFVEDSKKECK